MFNSKGNSMSYASHLASYNDNPNHLSHIWEFYELAKRVAIEQIYEIVPSLVNEACHDAMSQIFEGAMKGIEYDVKSILDISIKDLNKQWHSETLTKFIGAAVKSELEKSLKNFDISLIFK